MVGKGRVNTACHSFYFLHQDTLNTLMGIINPNNNVWRNANEILLTANIAALVYPHHHHHPLLHALFFHTDGETPCQSYDYHRVGVIRNNWAAPDRPLFLFRREIRKTRTATSLQKDERYKQNAPREGPTCQMLSLAPDVQTDLHRTGKNHRSAFQTKQHHNFPGSCTLPACLHALLWREKASINTMGAAVFPTSLPGYHCKNTPYAKCRIKMMVLY